MSVNTNMEPAHNPKPIGPKKVPPKTQKPKPETKDGSIFNQRK